MFSEPHRVADRLSLWLAVLDGIEGQWATVQDSWGVANDPSLRVNGMIASLPKPLK